MYLRAQEYKYIPFPDSGAIWSEMYYPPIFSGENPNYERFAVSGEDTVVNGTVYKKLYQFYDTIFIRSRATYIGGIREDDTKKVYYCGSEIHFLKPSFAAIIQNDGNVGDELLLYDFSLNIGDTLKNGNLTVPDEFLVVSDIDTINAGNSYRKMFHFEPIWWVKWIEGIGSIKGLLFTSGDLPTNGLDNDLICFRKNDSILYFNGFYDDCIPLIAGIETDKKNLSGIEIYPNPTHDNSIHFNPGDKNVKKIEIIDCSGIIVDCLRIADTQSEIIYSTEKLHPGIYFIMVTDDKGTCHNGRFIVQ